MVEPVTGRVPDPKARRIRRRCARDGARARPTWGSRRARRSTTLPIDRVFIGSCTNARIEDLRAAASVARGPSRQHVACARWSCRARRRSSPTPSAKASIEIFADAGFEWREPGCSMCLGMNDDVLGEGERCASTSNRNFEGRQGTRRPHAPGQPGDGGGRRDRGPLHRRSPVGVPVMAAGQPLPRSIAAASRRCGGTTSTPIRSSRSSS